MRVFSHIRSTSASALLVGHVNRLLAVWRPLLLFTFLAIPLIGASAFVALAAAAVVIYVPLRVARNLLDLETGRLSRRS